MNSAASFPPPPWFRRWGWFYLPVHPAGFAVVAAAAAFLVQVFLHVDGRSHSVSDTLYGFYPFAAPTVLGVLGLAARTSDEQRGNR